MTNETNIDIQYELYDTKIGTARVCEINNDEWIWLIMLNNPREACRSNVSFEKRDLAEQSLKSFIKQLPISINKDEP